MLQSTGWLGSVWSLRSGTLVIGKVRVVERGHAILSVMGLGAQPPAGVEVVPPGPDGAALVRVSLTTLASTWKRMGAAPRAGSSIAPRPAGEGLSS